MYLQRMTYLIMRISSQGEDLLFYLQIKRVIGTPMKIQEISQFLACAAVDLSTLSGNILLGAGDDKEVAGPSADIPSRRNKGSKANVFL